MDISKLSGVLGQLGGGSTPPPLRGRPKIDRSFYTYGADPRGNSPGGPLPGPGAAADPGRNYASGGPANGPGGILAGLAGAAGAPEAASAPVPGTDGGGMLRALGGVKGPGSGREDLIDAKLSDGEWVADAETVALLGDGSSDEGIRRLEEMRKNLRSHKGKALSKGRFSPDAKRPEQYLGQE